MLYRFLFATFLLIFSLHATNAQTTGSATGCRTVFRQNQTTVTTGATAMPQYVDRAGCEAGCLSDVRCQSYQIASTSPVCWFQYNAINLNNVWAAPGVIEYLRLQDCTNTGCQISYVANSTAVGLGAIARPDLLSQAACESACSLDVLCLSYQISANPGETLCWLQYTGGSSSRFVAGVTEFAKICAVNTLNTVATTKSPTIVCLNYGFAANGTMVSYGATPYYNYVSRTYCESACRLEGRCLSYQFASSYGYCSLQFNRLTSYCSKPGYVEYVKQCVQIACSISFVKNSTLVSTGAVAYTQYTTAATCANACTMDTTCVSYQLDSNFNTRSFCWLNFRTVDPTRLANIPGVQEFFRQCI